MPSLANGFAIHRTSFDIDSRESYTPQMPILPAPDYTPPFPFRSGNLATLYPPLFRLTHDYTCTRERIETPDGDFLDVDRHASRIGMMRRLAVISHGLEGNSRKKYILGMAHMMTGLGYDAACWCQRGCSGEPNRLPRTYHSGETEDLHSVITHCLATGAYDEVILIGFSMGGNQILKYLGEAPERVPTEVKEAATFSVPCDLAATQDVIALPSRRIYQEYFMIGLREKIRIKGKLFPDEVNASLLNGIDSLHAFDERFTAPICGFADADDYYEKSSSKQFLTRINIPTLLVQAKDDPFLPSRCYPRAEAEANPNLMLEMPRCGGHVGFVQAGPNNVYWSENRVKEFLEGISELPS